MNPPTTPCGLCGRAFDRAGLTKHHCLPRSKGGTTEHVELLCGMCHGMVHATFTNQTLAAVYPANIHMAVNSDRFPSIHPELLWARLPLQFVFARMTWHGTR